MARPITATAMTARTSLRSIGYPFLNPSVPLAPRPKSRRAARAAALRSLSRERSVLLRPIILVAAAAVLGDARERGLEAVGILDGRRRGFGIGAELLEPGVEVSLVLPDR